MVAGCKTVDWDTDETGSVRFGLRWMWNVMDQPGGGFWKTIYELSMLFHDRGQSSQDECHGVEVRRYWGSFLELMMILMSFQNMSVALFRHEHRGPEKRIHSTELNHVLNTAFCGWHPYCLQVAPCPHLKSPLSHFPPHSTPCLWNDRNCRIGLEFLDVNELMMWLVGGSAWMEANIGWK